MEITVTHDDNCPKGQECDCGYNIFLIVVEKMKIKGGIQNVPPNLRYLAELALKYKQNQ